MAEFLNTSRISTELERIITDAEERLVIISPYIKVEQRILEKLEDAAKRGITVRVIHGKRDLRSDERGRLKPLSSLSAVVELLYRENLHAKCYLNEEQAILTSMNLYEVSKGNDEMGILVFRAGNDRPLYQDIEAEAHWIYTHSSKSPSASAVKPISRVESSSVSEQPPTVTEQTLGIPCHGFCIRCKNIVLLEPLKPYCSRCFADWNKYGNTEYGESYCHLCGEFNTRTVRKPLCLSCYRIYQGEFFFYSDFFS